VPIRDEIAESLYWLALAETASKLSYIILARLYVSPLTLPALYREILSYSEDGLLPADPTIIEVANEVALFKKLGVINEGSRGLLYLNHDRLEPLVRRRIEEYARRLEKLAETPLFTAKDTASLASA